MTTPVTRQHQNPIVQRIERMALFGIGSGVALALMTIAFRTLFNFKGGCERPQFKELPACTEEQVSLVFLAVMAATVGALYGLIVGPPLTTTTKQE